jgi:hypothetical protein
MSIWKSIFSRASRKSTETEPPSVQSRPAHEERFSERLSHQTTIPNLGGDPDMTQDLITPDNLSKELLKSIFDDALMETSFDNEGDLRVREDLSCFVLPNKDRIRLLSFFGFEPHVSQQKRLEFVNRVNSEYVIVRAAVGSKNDTLFFDYDISVRGGITKKALVFATKRFLSIPRQAIQEFGTDLVK